MSGGVRQTDILIFHHQVTRTTLFCSQLSYRCGVLVLQARSEEDKSRWCQCLKRLILDNYDVDIPSSARHSLLMLASNQAIQRGNGVKTSLEYIVLYKSQLILHHYVDQLLRYGTVRQL